MAKKGIDKEENPLGVSSNKNIFIENGIYGDNLTRSDQSLYYHFRD